MSNDKVRAAAQVVLDTCPLHLMPTREAAGAIGALRDALAEVDAKVEPVADNPEQSSASTPTKLGSGPSPEGAVGSDAATSSGPDEVAAGVAFSVEYMLETLRGYNPPDRVLDHQRSISTHIHQAAALIERLAAQLRESGAP